MSFFPFFEGLAAGFVAKTRWIIAILFLATLSACNTGSGGQQPSTTVTLNNLVFNAASPDATPAPQTLTATFSPGTVYLAVLRSGPAVGDVTYTLSGNTAQIVVSPGSPSALGAGIFTGTVSIAGYTCADAACTQLVSGSAQTVNVTLQVPPIVRFVAPYVAPAGTSENVIIRGQGFTKFPVQGLNFGGTPASAFTIVSDTQIQATLPSTLTANTYPVQLLVPTSPGPVLSTNLVVVGPTGLSGSTVAYPSTISTVQKLVYDAERESLLLAVNNGEVLRYSFLTSNWTTSSAIAGLTDIAPSPDGTQVLALSQTALTPLDPAGLTPIMLSNPAPPALASGTTFKNLVMGNDGNAVITTGFSGSTATPLYLYNARSLAFSQPATTPSLDNATPGVSADGSLVPLVQGDPTLASAPPTVYQYFASTNTFAATILPLNQNSIAPALDRNATRIVLNGTNVYDTNYVLLGTLPSTTLAVIVRPDAQRAYTFDSSGNVLIFDVSTSQNGGSFLQVGSITPVSSPGTGVQMAISPDGGTLFLAGAVVNNVNGQVVVVPLPP